MSIANEFRPSSWGEFLGSNIGVDYLKSAIRTNKHPSAIILTANPGCGKSSLAQLYTRATLCIEREEGSIEGCGRCSVCKGEDTSNITHYLVKDSSGAKDNIERLVDISYTKPHIREGIREDQYRRFIVIDEAELIHPTTISALLNPLEYPPSTTTWILISMDSSKLPLITREAIESRCKEIRLKPLSISSIASLLEERGGASSEIALLIAKACNFNTRRAWSLLELVGNKSLDEVRNHFLGEATDTNRREMWQALSNGEIHKVRGMVSRWEQLIDNSSLINLLMEDLIEMDRPPLDLIRGLAEWSRSTTKYPLAAVLYPYRDFYIEVSKVVEKEEPTRELLPIGEVDASYSTNLMNLIKSKVGVVHPLARYTSIGELIEAYAMD
jgi:DNA polymerase III subunit gamma/tau